MDGSQCRSTVQSKLSSTPGQKERAVDLVLSPKQSLLAFMFAIALIFWALTSTAFLIMAMKTIASTTSMCSERLISEVERSMVLDRQNRSLVESNNFMLNRLKVYDEFLLATKIKRTANYGIGGPRK
jgi:hypothetical protein